MQTQELLTLDEAAQKLRVTPDTLRTWIRARRLPVIRISRRTQRIDFADFLRALQETTEAPR